MSEYGFVENKNKEQVKSLREISVIDFYSQRYILSPFLEFCYRYFYL